MKLDKGEIINPGQTLISKTQPYGLLPNLYFTCINLTEKKIVSFGDPIESNELYVDGDELKPLEFWSHTCDNEHGLGKNIINDSKHSVQCEGRSTLLYGVNFHCYTCKKYYCKTCIVNQLRGDTMDKEEERS